MVGIKLILWSAEPLSPGFSTSFQKSRTQMRFPLGSILPILEEKIPFVEFPPTRSENTIFASLH